VRSGLNPLDRHGTVDPRDDHELLASEHWLRAMIKTGWKDYRRSGAWLSGVTERREPGASAFKIVVQVADNGEIAVEQVGDGILVGHVMATRRIVEHLSSAMLLECDAESCLDQRLDDLVHLLLELVIKVTHLGRVQDLGHARVALYRGDIFVGTDLISNERG